MCVMYRSNCPKVFCEKGVLSNFAKFTGKHLCQSLFLNKVTARKPAALLKKRLLHRCFLANFAKFLWTPFLTENLRWLLHNWIILVFGLWNISNILWRFYEFQPFYTLLAFPWKFIKKYASLCIKHLW